MIAAQTTDGRHDLTVSARRSVRADRHVEEPSYAYQQCDYYDDDQREKTRLLETRHLSPFRKWSGQGV